MEVVNTHALATTDRPCSAIETATRKHGDRAGLASFERCPNFSGSGDSGTKEDSGDSREELHVCTSVVFELCDEFSSTFGPTTL